MMSEIASSEQLFAVADRPRRFKEFPLPVSGLTVRIRSLREDEVSDYQAELVAKSGRGFQPARLKDANRRLIALCLVDAAGNRLLANGDTAKLAKLDYADAGALYDECAGHAGINREDIETIVKNSAEIPVDNSPSD